MTTNYWDTQLDFSDWPLAQKEELATLVKKQIGSKMSLLNSLDDAEPISLTEEFQNDITDRVMGVITAGDFAADVVTFGTMGVACVFSALLNPIFKASPTRKKNDNKK